LRVGVSSLHLIGKPFRSLLDAIRTYGVDLWEIVDDDTFALTNEKAKALLDLKRSEDVDYTVHAHFVDINIAAVNESFRSLAISRLNTSLRFTQMIDANIWVFHPGIHSGLNYFYPQRDIENCILSVAELSDVAKRFGIAILIENMPASETFLLRGTDDFEQFSKLAGKSSPDMVLDIGHANTTNEIESFIGRQGEQIRHVHAHDNNGVTDSHNGIGDGTVPWKVVASKLNRSGFSGSLIVESVREVAKSIKTARQLFV
jgi:sugar phosphate isomerase/epimerase